MHLRDKTAFGYWTGAGLNPYSRNKFARGDPVFSTMPLDWSVALLVFAICCYLPVPAYADTKILTAEGTYIMGDGETSLVAELRALQQAKRMAVEQAATYMQSYTKTKLYDLTADEIEAISAGLIEVGILEKKRQVVADGIQFYVKIKATVTVENADELASPLFSFL